MVKILKFNDFSLLCPNEREARIAMQDKYSGLESLSSELMKNTNAKRLIMKLGAEGFIAYDHSQPDKKSTQAFPALTVNPIDVSGAGDSLLSAMSLGISNKQCMMKSAAIGACVASIAVSRIGNVRVQNTNLKEYINALFEN